MRTRIPAVISMIVALLTLVGCSQQSSNPTPPAGATAVQQPLGQTKDAFNDKAPGVSGKVDQATVDSFNQASTAAQPVNGSDGVVVSGQVSGLGERSLYLVDIASQAMFGTVPEPFQGDGQFSFEDKPIGSPSTHSARPLTIALIVVDPGTSAKTEFDRVATLPGGSDTTLNRKLIEQGGTVVWSQPLYYMWP
jgi:hypothetical protein